MNPYCTQNQGDCETCSLRNYNRVCQNNPVEKMTKQAEQTEVVKIRLGSDDKARLQEIAEQEGRTFAAQCRRILKKYLDTIRGAA